MKYSIFHSLTVAIVVFLSSLELLSSESGWEQRQGYKYQKLVLSNLVNVQMSSDKNTIYTYHSDAMLRVWDFQSGVLLDSIKFNLKPDEFQFSKDGKTAVIIDYGIASYNPNLSRISIQKIQIYDLHSKKILCNDDVDFRRHFSSNNLEDYKSSYDYVSDRNELYVRSSGNSYGYGGAPNIIAQYTCGHFTVLGILQNSLIVKREISGVNPLGGVDVIDFLNYNDSLLLYSTSSFYTSFYYLPDSQQKMTSYSWNNNGLVRFNLHNHIKSGLVTYYNSFTPAKGYSGASGYVGGIIPTCLNNCILFNVGGQFYYYDLSLDSILSNVSIPIPYSKGKLITDTYSANDVLVLYQGSAFYFNDIRTSDQIDSIIPPISITSFTVTNNDKSILAWNIKGEVIVIDIARITPVKEETVQSQENTVYPNPSTGIITLKNSDFQSSQLKIDLIDITGSPVRVLYNNFYSQEELRFDLSIVPAGIYGITAHQNNKIISFKVIKE